MVPRELQSSDFWALQSIRKCLIDTSICYYLWNLADVGSRRMLPLPWNHDLYHSLRVAPSDELLIFEVVVDLKRKNYTPLSEWEAQPAKAPA
jgi:hypothetical protein